MATYNPIKSSARINKMADEKVKGYNISRIRPTVDATSLGQGLQALAQFIIGTTVGYDKITTDAVED